MPPTLTPSPGQPSHLEHLRNFCLHQVKGYSRKAAPGLDIFDKAELGSGIPVPSPFSAELRCSPAWGRVTAPVLPLLRKHPVPYLGRRLFFNFLEHLNRARQGWCAKGHPWRGGEAAGRSSPHIEERAVQEVVHPSIPNPTVPSRSPGAGLQTPLPLFDGSSTLDGGDLPCSNKEELATKPSAAKPLSQGLKFPKVFLSSYLTRQVSFAHQMPL